MPFLVDFAVNIPLPPGYGNDYFAVLILRHPVILLWLGTIGFFPVNFERDVGIALLPILLSVLDLHRQTGKSNIYLA
jgi:hypothetical protein